MDLIYDVILSDRKSIAIEITRDLRIIVRAPYGAKSADVKRFVEAKQEWIEKHAKAIKEKSTGKTEEPVLTSEELNKLAQKALEYFPKRVAFFAPLVGVSYGEITIRNQKTRFGSCSDRGNLNFNCILMLCPPEVTDYVIVHELCHRKQLNHSKQFWAEVARVMPEYKKHSQWLKENGTALIKRLG